ncbi:hypothetical protein Pelo_13298 [Pelomyxa schiedti]|nr:hypothetical protein Pelo_13298 [Pelomyxa schiedti]
MSVPPPQWRMASACLKIVVIYQNEERFPLGSLPDNQGGVSNFTTTDMVSHSLAGIAVGLTPLGCHILPSPSNQYSEDRGGSSTLPSVSDGRCEPVDHRIPQQQEQYSSITSSITCIQSPCGPNIPDMPASNSCFPSEPPLPVDATTTSSDDDESRKRAPPLSKNADPATRKKRKPLGTNVKCKYCVHQTCHLRTTESNPSPGTHTKIFTNQRVDSLEYYSEPRIFSHNRVALFKGHVAREKKDVVFLYNEPLPFQNGLYVFTCGIWVEDNDLALTCSSLTIGRKALYFDSHYCVPLLQKNGEAFSWPVYVIGREYWHVHLAAINEKEGIDSSRRLHSPLHIPALTDMRLASKPLHGDLVSMSSAMWISVSTDTPVCITMATNYPSPLSISPIPLQEPPSASQSVCGSQIFSNNYWVLPSCCKSASLLDNGRTVQIWGDPKVFLAHMQESSFCITVKFDVSNRCGVGVSTLCRKSYWMWEHPPRLVWEHPPQVVGPRPAQPSIDYKSDDTIEVQVDWQGRKIWFSIKSEEGHQPEEPSVWLPLPRDSIELYPAVHLHGKSESATLVSRSPTILNQGHLYDTGNKVDVGGSTSHTSFTISGHTPNHEIGAPQWQGSNIPTPGYQGNQEEAAPNPTGDIQQARNCGTQEEHIYATKTEENKSTSPSPGTVLPDQLDAICQEMGLLQILPKDSAQLESLTTDLEETQGRPSPRAALQSTFICTKPPLNDHCVIEYISDKGSRQVWKLTLKDCSLKAAERCQLASLVPGNILWIFEKNPLAQVTIISNLSVIWTCTGSCVRGNSGNLREGVHLERIELFAPFSEDDTSEIFLRFTKENKEDTASGATRFHAEIKVTKCRLEKAFSRLGLDAATKLLEELTRQGVVHSSNTEETILQADFDLVVGLNSQDLHIVRCRILIHDLWVFGLPIGGISQFNHSEEMPKDLFFTMQKPWVQDLSASSTTSTENHSNLYTLLCAMNVAVSNSTATLLKLFVLTDYKLVVFLSHEPQGGASEPSGSFILHLDLQVTTDATESGRKNYKGCVLRHACRTYIVVELGGLCLDLITEALGIPVENLPFTGSFTLLEFIEGGKDPNDNTNDHFFDLNSNSTFNSNYLYSPSLSHSISRLLCSSVSSYFCLKADFSWTGPFAAMLDLPGSCFSGECMISDQGLHVVLTSTGIGFLGLNSISDVTCRLDISGLTLQSTFPFAYGIRMQATLQYQFSLQGGTALLDFESHPDTGTQLPFSLPQLKNLSVHQLQGEAGFCLGSHSFLLGGVARAIWTDGPQPTTNAVLKVAVERGNPMIATAFLSYPEITMGSLIRLLTGCNYKNVAFLDQAFPIVTQLELLYKTDNLELEYIPSMKRIQATNSTSLTKLIQKETGRQDPPLLRSDEKCISFSGRLQWLGIDARITFFSFPALGTSSPLKFRVAFKEWKCSVGSLVLFEIGPFPEEIFIELNFDTAQGTAHFQVDENLQIYLLPSILESALTIPRVLEIAFQARRKDLSINAALVFGNVSGDENTVKVVSSLYEPSDKEIVMYGQLRFAAIEKLHNIQVNLKNFDVKSKREVTAVVIAGLQKCISCIFNVCKEALKEALNAIEQCAALPQFLRGHIMPIILMAVSVANKCSNGVNLVASMIQRLTPSVLDIKLLCVDGELCCDGKSVGVDVNFDITLFSHSIGGTIHANLTTLLSDLCKKLIQFVLVEEKILIRNSRPMGPIVKLSEEEKSNMEKPLTQLWTLIEDVKEKIPERILSDEEAYQTLPHSLLADPLLSDAPQPPTECPHCRQSVPPTRLTSHAKECLQKTEVGCAQCGEKVRVIDQERHANETCRNKRTRLLFCKFCHSEIDPFKIQEHENRACVGHCSCPMCNEQMERRVLVAHLKSGHCPKGTRDEVCEKCDCLKERPHICSFARCTFCNTIIFQCDQWEHLKFSDNEGIAKSFSHLSRR